MSREEEMVSQLIELGSSNGTEVAVVASSGQCDLYNKRLCEHFTESMDDI